MAPQNSTLLHGNSEFVKGFGLYSPIARSRCDDLADHDNDDDDNSSSYSVTTDVHDVIDRKKSIAEFRRALDADEVCANKQREKKIANRNQTNPRQSAQIQSIYFIIEMVGTG